MLWKLLKYDFRSMWKQFQVIWPAALIIGLVNRFTIPFDGDVIAPNGWLTTISISLLFGVMFAMFIASAVFVLTRFYKGLLGDEGYLMHTLPVKSWQLVLSKLLCALVVTMVNGIVGILTMFLVVPLSWSDIFDPRLWKMLVQGIQEQPDVILFLVEFLLMLIALFTLTFTALYLAMAIGHLFSRRRVLWSVVAFFGLDVVGSVITSSLHNLGIFYQIEMLVMNSSDHLAAWASIAVMLLPAALMFMGTSWILKNKLNLE